jgi:hypothetical protein
VKADGEQNYFSNLKMEEYVPPKCQLIFNRLHNVISQEIVLFITTAVGTSNPTLWLCFNKQFSGISNSCQFYGGYRFALGSMGIYLAGYSLCPVCERETR